MVSRQFELPLRYMITAGQDRGAYQLGSEGEGFCLRINNGNNGSPSLCPALFGVDAVIHSASFGVITRSATDTAVDDAADWKLVIEKINDVTGLDPAGTGQGGIDFGTRLWSSRTLTSGGSAGLIYPNVPTLLNQKINLRVPAGSILAVYIERQGSVSDRNIAVSANFDVSYDAKGLKQRNMTKKSAFFVVHGSETSRTTTTHGAMSIRCGAVDPAAIDPTATSNEVFTPLLPPFPVALTRLRWAVLSTGVRTFTLSVRASKRDHALGSNPYGTDKAIYTSRSITSVVGQWVVGGLESPGIKIPQFFESGAYARPQIFTVATPSSTGTRFSVITWLEFERI